MKFTGLLVWIPILALPSFAEGSWADRAQKARSQITGPSSETLSAINALKASRAEMLLAQEKPKILSSPVLELPAPETNTTWFAAAMAALAGYPTWALVGGSVVGVATIGTFGFLGYKYFSKVPKVRTPSASPVRELSPQGANTRLSGGGGGSRRQAEVINLLLKSNQLLSKKKSKTP